MHDFLLKEVDSAIRDLLIAMLRSQEPQVQLGRANPPHPHGRQSTPLTSRKAMQKCVADAKHLSEQIAEL